ncbi:probable Xaa-Pro aminopeptidase P, partial [Tanacetum coccineum]
GGIALGAVSFFSDAINELKETVAVSNHELVYLYDVNLVDEVWKEARPMPPNKLVRVHDLKHAVAWLLNLRGNDVPHSPVMYAYLIVEMDATKLFVDNFKVTPEVMDYLKTAGIELKPYGSILSEIKSLATRGAHLWLDTASVNAAIASTYATACNKCLESLGSKNKGKNLSGAPSALCKSSPVSLAKAVKNDAELEGMRNSHI